MENILNSLEIGERLPKLAKSAVAVRVAMAQVTPGGLGQVLESLAGVLKRGGEVRFLVGVDIGTDPQCIQELWQLENTYTGRMNLRRFASDGGIFHPKIWIFSSMSGRLDALIGSSNLTDGGFGRNWEANILVSGELAGEVDEYFDTLWGGRAKRIEERRLAHYRKDWAESLAARRAMEQFRKRVQGIQAQRSKSSKVPERIRGHRFAVHREDS